MAPWWEPLFGQKSAPVRIKRITVLSHQFIVQKMTGTKSREFANSVLRLVHSLPLADAFPKFPISARHVWD